MSSLGPGDEDMHYSNGSHRWFPADPDVDVVAWEAALRAHQAAHRADRGGGAARAGRLQDRQVLAVPRQRRPGD